MLIVNAAAAGRMRRGYGGRFTLPFWRVFGEGGQLSSLDLLEAWQLEPQLKED